VAGGITGKGGGEGWPVGRGGGVEWLLASWRMTIVAKYYGFGLSSGGSGERF